MNKRERSPLFRYVANGYEYLWRCSECLKFEWREYCPIVCNHCKGKIEAIPRTSRLKEKPLTDKKE